MENEERIPKRGSRRESELPASRYFDDSYFSIRQLCSQAMQIHLIHALRPKNLLEIGIGNGLTASFLRRSGLSVTTADINAGLMPDVCGSIEELPALLKGQAFDVVVCCEVLEHLPLESLDANLNSIRSLGDRLFLTLPINMPARWYGFGGFLRLPRFGDRLVSLSLPLPWQQRELCEQHYWEVGWNDSCSAKAITEKLLRNYRTVRSGRFALNPFHAYFIAE
jgi:hypothetical protein